LVLLVVLILSVGLVLVNFSSMYLLKQLTLVYMYVEEDLDFVESRESGTQDVKKKARRP